LVWIERFASEETQDSCRVMESAPLRGSVWLAESRESLYPVKSHTLPRSGTDFVATRILMGQIAGDTHLK